MNSQDYLVGMKKGQGQDYSGKLTKELKKHNKYGATVKNPR